METQINLFKPLVTALATALAAVVRPALPAVALCTAMIAIDTFTAWRLSCRVRRKHPEAPGQPGRIHSRRLGRALVSLGKVYVLLLVSAAIDVVLTPATSVLQLSAGAVTAWQAVSILENESSCTEARWPSWLKRYLADKVGRHLH
ncbi:MAG: hypothetical protein ACI4US_00805 [Muribaculaceae bacterium]